MKRACPDQIDRVHRTREARLEPEIEEHVEWTDMRLRSSGAILSQLYHLAALPLSKREMRLGKGTLKISINVDVGSKSSERRTEDTTI